MISFSLQTKISLTELHTKSLCCKKSLMYGMMFYGAKFGISDITFFSECEEVVTLMERLLLECYGGVCDIDYHSGGFLLTISDFDTLGALARDRYKFKQCNKCQAHYIRGIFIACGSVNSPDASYRLELRFKRDGKELEDRLCGMNLNFKTTVRGKDNVIYIKESESIEDFLNYIGAMNAAFTLMNEKIKREIRNDVNRANNCDTANIKKSIAATKTHIDAILKLQDDNRIQLLPKPLQETAGLRLAFPDMSLSDLADMHEPKITKSGLNHRLKKIVEFSENGE
ncbi:MAG: DNA-binding protein WhiA [Clostridia bacterium]|nr:DNA-binding protein WhiA [Clostridia bacterium]